MATHTSAFAAMMTSTNNVQASSMTATFDIRAKNRSTWVAQDPATWNWAQRTLFNVGAVQIEKDVEYPKAKQTDPVPYFPIWKQHLWVMPRALAPLTGHWAIVKFFGSFHPAAAFIYYTFCLTASALSTIGLLKRLSKRYGFFDSEKTRDGIPNLHGEKVFWSLIGTVSIRPLFAVFVAYDRYELPSLIWWALPFQMALYATVLDFFFYVYHRAMHEV